MNGNVAYTSFDWLPDLPPRDFDFFPGEVKVLSRKELLPNGCADWSERYREIRQSSIPGLWRHENAPYFEEPMRVYSLPWVREVRVCAGSQLGKTEFQYNTIGYATDYDPGPGLFVMPSKDTVQRSSVDRIQPMFLDCDPLRAIVSKNPDDMGTFRIKTRTGVTLYMGWAGSDAVLASNPMKHLWIDEADLVGRRAINLARARLRTFLYEYKLVEVSKPSVEDGPIWEDLNSSHVIFDFYVPCPHCGHHQIMVFGQIRWTPGVTDPKKIEVTRDAWYECEECTGRWNEIHRDAAVKWGQWKPRRFCAECDGVQMRDGLCPRCGSAEPAPLPDFPEIAGYHLPAFPSRFVRFSDVVADYLRYQQDPHAKEGDAPSNAEKFWCDDCALPMPTTHEGETLDEQALYDRREEYGPERAEWVVPMDAALLTCAVDVQGNRLEVLVEAWGPKRENWGIEHEIISGSPSHDSTWQELEDRFLNREYRHESGADLLITGLGVDIGGHHSDEALKFVKKWRRRRKVFALKGWHIAGKPIKSKPAASAKKRRFEVPVHMVGTEAAKDTIFGWLSCEEPGPYYQHFPRSFGFEFFRQLCSEEPELKKNAAGRIEKRYRVRKGYKRNEGLDLKVYSLAVYEILSPVIDKVRENIRKKSEEPVHAPEESSAQGQEKRQKKTPRPRGGFVSGWKR